MYYFPDFLYKSICCGYSIEFHRQVDAIQMGNHNICLYKVDKKYTGCNLKTMALINCGLLGVCAVIRSNTVVFREKKGFAVHMNCLLQALFSQKYNKNCYLLQFYLALYGFILLYSP